MAQCCRLRAERPGHEGRRGRERTAIIVIGPCRASSRAFSVSANSPGKAIPMRPGPRGKGLSKHDRAASDAAPRSPSFGERMPMTGRLGRDEKRSDRGEREDGSA
ncbi:hypothetical protein Skr01_48840 [Sphaerisporangium krabiense]|nr:hypothetical protein Skr01_48840 [Sphaerisporangium krabiense]